MLHLATPPPILGKARPRSSIILRKQITVCAKGVRLGLSSQCPIHCDARPRKTTQSRLRLAQASQKQDCSIGDLPVQFRIVDAVPHLRLECAVHYQDHECQRGVFRSRQGETSAKQVDKVGDRSLLGTLGEIGTDLWHSNDFGMGDPGEAHA